MISKYFSDPEDSDYQSYYNVRVRGKCWTLYLKDDESSVLFTISSGNV